MEAKPMKAHSKSESIPARDDDEPTLVEPMPTNDESLATRLVRELVRDFKYVALIGLFGFGTCYVPAGSQVDRPTSGHVAGE
jgi:hypothetical protein